MKFVAEKSSLKVAIFIYIYMMSFNIPYIFSQIPLVRAAFTGTKLILTILLLIKLLLEHTKWSGIDYLVICFCITIIASGLYAGIMGSNGIALGTYLRKASSLIVVILGNLFLSKLMYNSCPERRMTIIKSILVFLIFYCTLNFALQLTGKTQLHLAGDMNGAFMFAGDNSSAQFYLHAFVYACFLAALEKKNFDWKFIYIIILTISEALYREIGALTVAVFFLVIVLLIYFLFSWKKLSKMNLNWVFVMIQVVYFSIMSLFTKIAWLQDLIDNYFFGKFNNFIWRFQVQSRIFAECFKSPVFGTGRILMGLVWINDWVFSDFSYKEFAIFIGKAHSVLIETLYNFGFLALILFVSIICLILKRISRINGMMFLAGCGILSMCVHGLVESFPEKFFYVLPMAYYMVEILAPQKSELGKRSIRLITGIKLKLLA